MVIVELMLINTCLLYQVRPPGHHALDSTVMGFCLHNNAAVAAKSALAAGAKKVLILDWVSMKKVTSYLLFLITLLQFPYVFYRMCTMETEPRKSFIVIHL